MNCQRCGVKVQSIWGGWYQNGIFICLSCANPPSTTSDNTKIRGRMNGSNTKVIEEACEIITRQLEEKQPDIRCIREQANLILKYAVKPDEQLNALLGIK